MHIRRRLVLAALAAAVLAPATPARADGDACATDAAPAKCYAAAAAAIKDTKPGEAAALYLKSYRIEPKIDPLAGYGLALALDNQPVPAVEALEKAVEEYDKVKTQLEQNNADANTLFQVIHRIELVKEEIHKLVAKVGKVQLKVTDKKLPPGVTVQRKGGSEIHSSDPSLLIVNPNSDVLVFTYPSGRTLDFEVNVPAGTISQVDVPPEPPLPKVAPPPPPPPVDEAAPLRKYGYFAGGTGAALVVFGFAYVLAADSPSAAVAGGLIGVGFAGVGVGGYLLYKASKKQKEQDARKASPPAKADEAEEDGETSLVPIISNTMIGTMLTGTF